METINNLQELCEYFEADTPQSLNRRLYKDTDCGASISLLMQDDQWLHNGDLRDQWERIKDCKGFTIQTIIEGSDAEVNSDTFLFPVAVTTLEAWMKEMESEASRLFDEANEPDEFGDIADYDYTADDFNFDAAREAHIFGNANRD